MFIILTIGFISILTILLGVYLWDFKTRQEIKEKLKRFLKIKN